MPHTRTPRPSTPARPSLRSTEERDRLALENLNLVPYLLQRWYPRLMASPLGDDLVQAGRIGLLRACELFRPEMGYQLTTYASWWVRQAIQPVLLDDGVIFVPDRRPLGDRRAIRAATRTIRLPEGAGDGRALDALVDRREPGEERLDDRLDVSAALSALTGRDRRVLVGYYLDGKSLAEVGEGEGITRERVRQLLRRAVRRLRVALGVPEPVE